jgi:hypothetical protein
MKPIGTYKSMVYPACEHNGIPALYMDKPYYARRREFLPLINKWADQVYTTGVGGLHWINLRIEG